MFEVSRVKGQISAENKYIFEWHCILYKPGLHFPDHKLCSSSKLVAISQEFSDSYLVITSPDFVTNSIRIFLCGCNKINESKFILRARLYTENGGELGSFNKIYLNENSYNENSHYLLFRIPADEFFKNIFSRSCTIRLEFEKEKVFVSTTSVSNYCGTTEVNHESTPVSDATVSKSDEILLRTKEANAQTKLSNKETKSVNDYPKELVQDLRHLLDSGNMSDIDICIGEEIIHVHKLILGARSSVFKKMLEHQCIETTANSITITDCEVSFFKIFLKYLYTGKIEDKATVTVMHLFALADKYDVKALRDTCSQLLQSELSSGVSESIADIVCPVLQLADRHQDSKLKGSAFSFISNHFPMVSKTQNWKDLIKSDFELTSEVLTLVATVLQNNHK